MSVLVTLRVPGDTEQFRQYVQDNAEQMRAIAERGKSAGAIHHQFGVGEGYVFVLDEWPTAEQFHEFFDGNPDIAEVMQGAGAQGPPEITVYEAVESADKF